MRYWTILWNLWHLCTFLFQLNQEDQSQSQSNSNNSPPCKLEESTSPVPPGTSVYVTCNKKKSSSPNPSLESRNPTSEPCDNSSVIKALTNPREPPNDGSVSVPPTLGHPELETNFKPTDGLTSGRRVSLAATSSVRSEEKVVDKRRASTSYLNGQTEVLIGEFNNVKNKIKTTAVVERQPSDDEEFNR